MNPTPRFADRELARRLEAAESAAALAFAAALRELLPEASGAALPVAGGCALFAGPRWPVSRAGGMGMDGAVEEEAFDRLEAFYRERGAAPVVDACPLAHESLVDLLAKRGYRIRHFKNVLVRSLAGVAGTAPRRSAVEVRRVAPAEGEFWARTVTQGFKERDEVSAEETALARVQFRAAGASGFVAWLDGDPAGAGGVRVHDGLAGLFGTSTRAAYRGRGVHAALLAARLAFGAQSGCNLATATTLPGSVAQRNAERAGFRVAYTRSVFVRPEP